MKIQYGLKTLTAAIILILFGVFLSAAGAAVPKTVNQQETLNHYGELPLYFIENRGQLDSSVKFYVKTAAQTLYFTDAGIVFDLQRGQKEATDNTGIKEERLIFNLVFEKARKGITITGINHQTATVNYFVGPQSTWQNNIPTYKGIIYKEIYPGIDLKVFGNNKDIEYEFIVNPGADPANILLTYNGIEGLSTSTQGKLLIATAFGTLKETKPYIYQKKLRKIEEVAGNFVIHKPADTSQTGKFSYGFKVAAYDPAYPLIIDPTLSYSTYLGGNAIDVGKGIAVDNNGNAYVTGTTGSTNFPETTGSFQETSAGNYDAFISKLSADGTTLLYSTYLGGSSVDSGGGIAVDSSGFAYVAGKTTSNNFPTKNQYADFSGSTDIFISKLSTDGTSLSYSTYFGGTGQDEANAIAVNSSGQVYITGLTNGESGFDVTTGAYQTTYGGIYDAFIIKFAADGLHLIYSTYLGGSGTDTGKSIAIDSLDNVYITGCTSSSTNFPTTSGSFQSTYGGGSYDAFVSKLSSNGTTLLYSTYLGGGSGEDGKGIAVNSSGFAYVIGMTQSSDFPTQNPYQAPLAGASDAFISKLSTDGTSLSYSTYWGGDGTEYGNAIAVIYGAAYFTGQVRPAANFPITAGSLQPIFAGGISDAFVAKLSDDAQPTNSIPTVTTQTVTSISTDSATGNGNITDLGIPNPSQHGVCWNTTGSPTTTDSSTFKGAASATGAFTSQITGLSPSTIYYVRAYATNTEGTAYGSEVSFTSATAPPENTAPTVTTQAVTDITTDSATGNGTITDLGSPNPHHHGFCWNTSGTPTIADDTVILGQVSATGVFSAAINNLFSNTTYYVRAFASNETEEGSEGGEARTAGTSTSYGNQVSFTTGSPAPAPPVPPTISTQATTGISSNAATGHGTIIDLGSPAPSQYGVCWDRTSMPTTADHVVSSGPATATGSFNFNITGLAPNTTYYVRFYAINSAGTVYGGQIAFTTRAAAIPTLNEWGMIIFSLLLLGMGYTVIRKQKI